MSHRPSRAQILYPYPVDGLKPIAIPSSPLQGSMARGILLEHTPYSILSAHCLANPITLSLRPLRTPSRFGNVIFVAIAVGNLSRFRYVPFSPPS